MPVTPLSVLSDSSTAIAAVKKAAASGLLQKADMKVEIKVLGD